ncbi:uncharacterized protein LOC143446332 isoform X1 [Clavelina lepadiformis]|uniref:uncharacterized protein LOC143446332 isoform X1 n=1 Tax=Clavelina lepadiformis TaxID=159417 RepID=UPI0040423CCD
MSYIPVVDFKSCGLFVDDVLGKDLEQAGHLLSNAFSEVGFVYITNSGITQESVNRINDVTKLFFEAPIEEKKRYSRLENNFGYVGLETEKINPARPGDYKEAFNVSGFLLNDTHTLWPDDISEQFSNVAKEFMEKCRCLTLRILQALGVGMELKDQHFFEKCHSLIHKPGNSTTLRTLFYPTLPSILKPNQIRLGEHSDYGSITLLFQDNVGGLQVQNLQGEYVNATPIDDTVLINIGDLFELWTQSKLKSTKHRVLIPEDELRRGIPRRSLAYFVHPDDEVLIDSQIEYKHSTSNEKSEAVKGCTSCHACYGWLL